jgi:hypothetical protein
LLEQGIDLQQFFLPERVDVQLELQVLHHREAVVRAEVKVRPLIDKVFHQSGELVPKPVHDRRVAHRRGDGVDECPRFNQQPGHLDAAALSRLVQGCGAGLAIGGQWVGARRKQGLNQRDVRMTGGKHQGRQAGLGIASVGIGAHLQQLPGQDHVVAVDRQQQLAVQVVPEGGDDRRRVTVRLPLGDLAVLDLHPRRELDVELGPGAFDLRDVMNRAESLVALDDQLAGLEKLNLGNGVAGAEGSEYFLNTVTGPQPGDDVADTGNLG